MYKTISLTGSWCALNCTFCQRKYLENMIHVTPSTAGRILHELYEIGVRGLLLSGGFRPDATLPIEPYVEVLREAKKKYGFVINAHLGLVTNKSLLGELRDIIDVVDYEFTLSKFIIKDVRRLHISPTKYVESLELIVDAGLHIVPHVFAWHPKIDVESAMKELEVIKNLDIPEITLLIYIDNTYKAISDTILAKSMQIIELIRAKYDGKVYMGCMRPNWLKPFLDYLLVEKAIVDRIANPHHKVRSTSSKYSIYDACCSIPERFVELFKIR